MTTSTTTPQTRESDGPGRFVDPADLVCGCCGEHAVELLAADGVEGGGFVHRDRSALCGTRVGQVMEPVEVSR